MSVFDRIPSPRDPSDTLVWPNGARIAVWLAPNLEYYEYQPPPGPVRDPWPRMPHPDILGYGSRDYGNRAGFNRLLSVVDRHHIPSTAVLNVGLLAHHPEILAACELRDWEFLCHGQYNTTYHWGLSCEEESAEIDLAIEIFESAVHRPFIGWFSPALSHTEQTIDLLAARGFQYFCDWVHDDRPTPLKTSDGWMVTVPYSLQVNDGVMVARGLDGPWIQQTITDAFDTLYSEGGRVLCIAVHPYIIGQPHRIGYLDNALSYILSHDDVWFATANEIQEWYRSTQMQKDIDDGGLGK